MIFSIGWGQSWGITETLQFHLDIILSVFKCLFKCFYMYITNIGRLKTDNLNILNLWVRVTRNSSYWYIDSPWTRMKLLAVIDREAIFIKYKLLIKNKTNFVSFTISFFKFHKWIWYQLSMYINHVHDCVLFIKFYMIQFCLQANSCMLLFYEFLCLQVSNTHCFLTFSVFRMKMTGCMR